MVGFGGKQTLTPARLRSNVCRYRRRNPGASTSQIARRFGISRQLAHKILKRARIVTRAVKSEPGKRFYKFQAKVRANRGKRRIAAALGIVPQTLWSYELPPGHPRHRPMPEEMREKYRELVESQKEP